MRVGDTPFRPRARKTGEDPLLEKLVGFLSGMILAHYFHRIGHDENLVEPVFGAIRNCSGAPARRLQMELLRRRPEAFLELFNGASGDSVKPEIADLPGNYRQILQEEKDPDALGAFLSEHFRSELLGLPEPQPSPAKDSGSADLAVDSEASHRLEIRVSGSLRIPLFPFLAVGQDGRLYRFGGFDGESAVYRLLSGNTRRTTRELPVRKCLAEYFLQMGKYADSRRIFDALGTEGRPGEHRGLWAAVYGSLGDRFFRQGRLADAARILERALFHRPNIPKARLQLTDAYRKTGRPEEAEQAMMMVTERYPNLNGGSQMTDRTGEDIRLSRTAAAKPGKREGKPSSGRDPGSGTNPIPRIQKPDIPVRAKREPAPRIRRSHSEEFLIDLTGEAQRGRFQPLIGRKAELRELLGILCCRDKKNPLLVGDAGVGKTALVEELARYLVSGSVPPLLQGKRLYALHLPNLVAGAKYRGEFEERMLGILDEIRQNGSLLYIDHLHTLVQPSLAKGGALDAGGLLKGPLVRGEIQMVGTTTFEEMQNTIEKDPSLCRCLQKVLIHEPPADETVRILLGSRRRYEEYHRVTFQTDALRGSLEAVQRYLPGGHLPDKALDVVDRAAAQVSLDVSSGLRSDRQVTERDLLATIADMGKIPSSRISEGFRQTLKGLENALGERIIGQPEAIETVSRVLRSSARGMKLVADRPNGVFLFLGPTGVGKTELARAMAGTLFGGSEGLIRIDMSEYMDRISSSRLIGASPGYVGYNDPNQLTDRVRPRPYSLVLLDEIEKADPQMIQLFLQVFDAGRLTDGRGRTVSFGATTVVMTTNLGSELYTRQTVGYSQGGAGSSVSRESLRKELMGRFSPEFLNRIDEFVFFRQLSEDDIQEIAEGQLQGIRKELTRQGIQLELSPEALRWIANRGYNPIWGARDLGRTLRREILDPLAKFSLSPEWPRVERIVIERQGDLLRFHPYDGRGKPAADFFSSSNFSLPG